MFPCACREQACVDVSAFVSYALRTSQQDPFIFWCSGLGVGGGGRGGAQYTRGSKRQGFFGGGEVW